MPKDKRTEDYITGEVRLMRNRFDTQLVELNNELIAMGHCARTRLPARSSRC